MHILPFADILAWCLMPNHFHLMVQVNYLELGVDTEGFAQSETLGEKNETLGNKKRTFNQSIGIMLRAYTQAINKQKHRSGALFRQKTKAECLTLSNNITPSFFNSTHGTIMNAQIASEQYPQICFNYIHQNPVKAHIVSRGRDYEFSSAPDYAGLRKGKLVNMALAKEYGLVFSRASL
jgi:putative transposase